MSAQNKQANAIAARHAASWDRLRVLRVRRQLLAARPPPKPPPVPLPRWAGGASTWVAGAGGERTRDKFTEA